MIGSWDWVGHGGLRRDRASAACSLGGVGHLEARHRALADRRRRRDGADAPGSLAAWTRSRSASSRSRRSSTPRWNILLKAADDPLRTAAVGRRGGVGRPRADRRRSAGSPSASRRVPPQAWALGHHLGRRRGRCTSRSSPRRSGAATCRSSTRWPAGSAPLLAIAIGVVHPRGAAGARRVARASGCCSRACCSSSGRGACSGPRRSANDRAAAGFALLTGATIATYSALDRVGRPADAGLGLRGDPVADVRGRPGRPGASRGRRVAGGRFAPARGAARPCGRRSPAGS